MVQLLIFLNILLYKENSITPSRLDLHLVNYIHCTALHSRSALRDAGMESGGRFWCWRVYVVGESKQFHI